MSLPLMKIFNNRLYFGYCSLILGGTVALFEQGLLYAPILIALGIVSVVVEVARRYILKTRSIVGLAMLVLLFSTLNFLRHKSFFDIFPNLGEMLAHEPEFHGFLLLQFVWLLISVWIFYVGIKLFRDSKHYHFGRYRHTREFKVLIFFILLLIGLEIPIWRIHGGFTGFHGHGIWDAWIHNH